MGRRVIRSMLATTALAWFGMSPAQAMRCAGEVIRAGNVSIGTQAKDPLRARTAGETSAGRNGEGARRKA